MKRTLIVTDTDYSFSSSDFAISGKNLGLGPAGYCRKRTLHGGSQEGVEILEISNGIISFRICPTRGMGIIDGWFHEKRIGWDSPVGAIIHPAYINLLEMGGRGCHYGFNEFFNRCGTGWMGAMGNDDIINNMGNVGSIFLPLHGKIGWTPADKVKLEWEDGTLVVSGEMREQIVFGQNYLLRTRLSLSKESGKIEIEDTLINNGSSEGEYELLYHINFGNPILGEGTRVYATYDAIMPRDQFAEEDMDDPFAYSSPEKDYIEKVFFIQGHPDEYGLAHNVIVDGEMETAACISYNTRELPYTVLWKFCNETANGYVTGLNPSTDLPNTRKSERDSKRLKKIKPGEMKIFNIHIEFYRGKKNICKAIEKIESKGGKKEKIPKYSSDLFPVS